jgi:hypothetical protein
MAKRAPAKTAAILKNCRQLTPILKQRPISLMLDCLLQINCVAWFDEGNFIFLF